ncbi:MAG: LysE family transporter [Rhodospirillaceae bacterium]|nr:LysE family transporter [Rhodospirillaceae bacterium]
MDFSHFLRGLLVGIALAAPVGPVGILCIRRALADGRYAAFVAGLGAACADAFYGAVAVLGLTVVSQFLSSHALALRLVGGAFMIMLGLHVFRQPPPEETEPVTGPGLIRDFISSFLITLTNPATILAAMGVFAAIGTLVKGQPGDPRLTVVGVFVGSSLWWLFLAVMAGAARDRFTSAGLQRLNRLSGSVLALFGIVILAGAAINIVT